MPFPIPAPTPPLPATLRLSDDRARLEISLAHCDGAIDAATVERLIGALQRARAAMLPAVAAELPSRSVVEAIADPRWRLEPAPLSGGVLLSYRDPGQGWRSVFFAPVSVARLARGFSAEVHALARWDDAPRN